MTASGTATAPIVLGGSPQAILDGGGTGGGYALHLIGAEYWKLQGFTVGSVSKGIVLDGSNHSVIDGVHVTDIGADGIHFRAFSSDNLLTNSSVDNTGVNAPNLGEEVYIGSAQSSWKPTVTAHRTIPTGIKSSTTRLPAPRPRTSTSRKGRRTALSGATTWVGTRSRRRTRLIPGSTSRATVTSSTPIAASPRRDPAPQNAGGPKDDPNSTKNPFCDGIQVHVGLDGWGQSNTLTSNKLEVNAPGAGIWLQNTAVRLRNVIACDNQVTGARAGAYATDHASPPACTP